MKHLKSAIRFHKDNGHRDDITGKVVNAHILGSDVLMITIGDTAQYHLVRYNPSKGQDYKFTYKSDQDCTLVSRITLCSYCS